MAPASHAPTFATCKRHPCIQPMLPCTGASTAPRLLNASGAALSSTLPYRNPIRTLEVSTVPRIHATYMHQSSSCILAIAADLRSSSRIDHALSLPPATGLTCSPGYSSPAAGRPNCWISCRRLPDVTAFHMTAAGGALGPWVLAALGWPGGTDSPRRRCPGPRVSRGFETSPR